MKQDLQDITARVQDAIFHRPEVALGFGIWSRYKGMMRTSQNSRNTMISSVSSAMPTRLSTYLTIKQTFLYTILR